MTRSEAARINGAKSRGPVTEEGRSRSSLNALKHGLAAARDKAFVCQNESQQGWDSLYNDLIQRFEPQGQIELDLVAELAHARCRLRRCCTIETGVLDAEMDGQSSDLQTRYDQLDDEARLSLSFSSLAENKRTLDVLTRYEARAGADSTGLCAISCSCKLPYIVSKAKTKFCRTNPSPPPTQLTIPIRRSFHPTRISRRNSCQRAEADTQLMGHGA
jgi:hypothetical protein